jgi:hypothetical protein
LQGVGQRGSFVHTRAHGVVVAPRHRGPHAELIERRPDAQDGVPGESVLRVARGGVGAAGVVVGLDVLESVL